jgi:PAS domain-containing protein
METLNHHQVGPDRLHFPKIDSSTIANIVTALGGAIPIIAMLRVWWGKIKKRREDRNNLEKKRDEEHQALLKGQTEIMTELRRMNMMLIKQDAANAAKMSAINLAYYECDSEGKCIVASPALCRIFGLSQDQMLGTGWTSVIEDKHSAWSQWQKSVQDDLDYDANYTIKNPLTGKKVILHTWAQRYALPEEFAESHATYIGFVEVVETIQ